MVTPFPVRDGHVSGGVESVADCLVKGLQVVEDDLDIHIIAPGTQAGFFVEQRNGLTIHWLPKMRLPGFIGYWTEQRANIVKTLKHLQPDIVHFQGVYGWSLGYKKPYVLTVHGIAEKDILYSTSLQLIAKFKSAIVGFVERRARKLARYNILISPYIKKELVNGFSGELIDIENPITADFFEIINQCESPPILLYVGRLNTRKNILGVLDTFKKVHQLMPDVILHLAGMHDDLAYKIRCEDFIAQHGLKDHVVFLGGIDREQLKQELARVRILLLLSYQETAPMIIEEAMAAGLPIVASNLCGIPWMVANGETGYLVDPDDTATAAKHIMSILSDNTAAVVMGEKARQVAQQRFHYIAVAKKTLELYRRAINAWPL